MVDYGQEGAAMVAEQHQHDGQDVHVDITGGHEHEHAGGYQPAPGGEDAAAYAAAVNADLMAPKACR